MPMKFTDGGPCTAPKLVCHGFGDDNPPTVTFEGMLYDDVLVDVGGMKGYISREEIAALAQLFPVRHRVDIR